MKAESLFHKDIWCIQTKAELPFLNSLKNVILFRIAFSSVFYADLKELFYGCILLSCQKLHNDSSKQDSAGFPIESQILYGTIVLDMGCFLRINKSIFCRIYQ